MVQKIDLTVELKLLVCEMINKVKKEEGLLL
jgi:hypothetical protein